MSSRPPNTCPAERIRQRLIRKLQKDLRRFESIPPSRREAEAADEGEETVRALLASTLAGENQLSYSASVSPDFIEELDAFIAEESAKGRAP